MIGKDESHSLKQRRHGYRKDCLTVDMRESVHDQFILERIREFSLKTY